ncbi:MAG TPA: hypothetical protein VK157_09760 [Phycisphaerales bacterium]|nr:hypothetical protein [Phycisphaerales bacterium]
MIKPVRPVFARPVALLLCVGSILSLGGCVDESPNARAIKDAANKVNAAGINAESAQSLANETKKAMGGLGQVSQGEGGEAMSAVLLQAQADLAEAEADAGKIPEAEGLIRANLALLTERSSQWANFSAVSTAAASFNPSKDLASFVAQKADRQKDLAEWTTKRDQMQRELTDLEARSKAEIDASKTYFQQASELMQRVSGVSAREGVPLVEQAAALRKQGDEKRLAGERLIAQIDAVKPQAAEATLMVNQFQAQIAALDTAIAELNTRKSENQSADTQAQADAGRIAGEIDTLVNDLMKAHDEAYLPAFTKATSSFGKTVNGARKAQADKPSKDAVSAGRVTAGSAQISLAGLHYGRAQLLDGMIGTLQVLSNTSPALPKKADYDARINALSELRKTSVEEASKALTDAQSSLGGVQGATRERMQQLSELIGKLDKVVKGEALDLSGKAPPPKLDADGVPVDAKAFMAKMVQMAKDKDFAGSAGLMHAESEDGKKMIAAQAKVSEAMNKLDEAFKAKFDEDLYAAIGKTPQGAMMGPMLKANDMSAIDPASITYAMRGDTVLVSLPGSPMPLEVKQVDGQWKMGLGQMEAMAAMALPMMEKLGTGAEELVAKVEAGEFADSKAAAEAFMKAMMAGMPGG